MSKILYSTLNRLSGDDHRRAYEIRKTAAGVAVKTVSMYSDEPTNTKYYKDYPEIPDNWDATINDSTTTEHDLWMHKLDGYKPYKTIIPQD